MSQVPKSQSEFARIALALDADFAAFERLARELDLLALKSDKGIERAETLLIQADKASQAIGKGMVDLGAALELSRSRTERAAQVISEKAEAVRERQEEVTTLVDRFRSLGGMVKSLTEAIPELKKPNGGELTQEESEILANSLPAFNEQVERLVDEARKLMDDAHAANLKILERNADSLRQSLQGAHHRLELFVKRHTAPNASELSHST